MKLYKEKTQNSDKLYTKNSMQEKLTMLSEYEHKRLGVIVDWRSYFVKVEASFNDYLKAVAEELGWSVKYEEQNSEKTITFQQHSPAGEDLELTFNYHIEEEIPQMLEEYYEGFNIDEHVEELVVARHIPGIIGVPTVSELLEDAKEIEKMLFQLSEATSKALTKYLHEDKEENE